MKFMKLYHVNETSLLEIFPDEYIKWQPITETEISEKIIIFSKVSERLRKKCLVVIDCDKAIYFDKVNYVLLEKMISSIDFPLSVIMKNCNDSLKRIINSLKIPKNINVYFNDIHRV